MHDRLGWIPMVYARMSTASLSSHIVLPYMCVYIYIYKSNRGRCPRRAKPPPPCILHGSYNVVLSSDTVCRIPKSHYTPSNRCVFVMDAAKGCLSAHPCIRKCAQHYGPVWFSLLSLYNRLRLHTSCAGRFRNNPRPAVYCAVCLRTHRHNFYTLNYILHVSYMRMSCTFVLKNV